MQKSFKEKKPTLYLVSTPIGNLGDITYRAVETLSNVDIIFAEDTRTSGILLKHYNINTKMSSYHEHQKYEKINDVIDCLKKDLDVGLISDAGTPGISDPGFELVSKVLELGYYVVSVPGAVAGITALTSSGLKMQPHLFIGFLPRKQSEIKNVLKKYKNIDATLIIYESPFRVSKTISYLYDIFGDKKIVIARELTKIYEEFIRTTLKAAKDLELNTKGEYVLLIENYNENEEKNETIESLYEKYMKEKFLEKDILKMIAKDLGIPKNEVYKKIKVKN